MEYVKSNVSVVVTCKIHGDFNIHVGNLINIGRGCHSCSVKASDLSRYTTQHFIAKAKSIHGDKFDYSLVEYKSSKDKVKIICPKHGEFEQLPQNHYKYDCRKCSSEPVVELLKQNENSFSLSGFKSIAKNRLCTFYIIRCFNNDEQFYKVGITTSSVKQRYYSKSRMPYAYEIMKEIIGDAEFIWQLENDTKHQLKQYHYLPIIKFAGSARECFTQVN